MISHSQQLWDTPLKEKIFGAQPGLALVDERQKFLEDWERKVKAEGLRRSLQSFWAYHWWQYLNDLDEAYNDHGSDILFVTFIWKV